MIETQAFEQYIESVSSEMTEYWEDFDTEDAWTFFTSVEEDYDCAGMCYVPMFYMTKNIQAGRPERECIRVLIEDVYTESQPLCYGMGGAFVFFVIC